MNAVRRQAYLRAMGIDIWIPRSGMVASSEADASPLASDTGIEPSNGQPEILVGPGSGSTLLLCASAAEAATNIASDISRSLEGEPVWAWLASGESAPGLSLKCAIEDHLFTRVLVFGLEPVARAEGGKTAIVGSARLIWTDSIPRLAESGEARQKLWQQLSASHWSVARAKTT